jgi:amphi-Trp domain-containing protein
MAEEKFVFDSLQDCETIKNFLEALIEGFEKHSIDLSTNGNEIHLEPQGLLNFTVKAKKKGTENKLSIKVTWKESSSAQASGNAFLKVR